MIPSIRIWHYLDEQKRIVSQYYRADIRAYPCNYYSLNLENSIYDDDELEAGSYRLGGDSLSGLKWIKILTVPVYFIENMRPSLNANERGVMRDLETYIVIPANYELYPRIHDFVHFPSSTKTDNLSDLQLFQVTNIEFDDFGNVGFYRCKLNISHRTKEEIDNNNLIDLKIFVEHEKKIYFFNQGEQLIQNLSNIQILYKHLMTFFDESRNLYDQKYL